MVECGHEVMAEIFSRYVVYIYPRLVSVPSNFAVALLNWHLIRYDFKSASPNRSVWVLTGTDIILKLG